MTEEQKPCEPQQIKQLFHKVKMDILNDGFSIIWVLPGEETMSFAYTVGLYVSYDKPELYVSGLNRQDSMKTLWEPIKLMKRGRTFKPGEIATDIFSCRCAFLKVMRKDYAGNFNVTRAYYGHSAFEALQLVIPDTKGRFPWEAGCDRAYVERQKIIGHRQP